MTDLTDKWKAGELEDDTVYYYKHSQYNVDGTARYFAEGNELYDEKDGIWLTINDGWRIFDKVPSGEELQALKAQLAEHKEYCCCAKNEVLVLENARLKELLKECEYYIINTPVLEQGSEQKTKEIHELLTKIEEISK